MNEFERVEKGIVRMHRKGTRTTPLDVATDIHSRVSQSDFKLCMWEQAAADSIYGINKANEGTRLRVARCRMWSTLSDVLEASHKEYKKPQQKRVKRRSRRGSEIKNKT